MHSATASTATPTPYVEPGAGDGAPHYRENNGSRIAGEMSPASAADAKKEADRIEPVLKALWQAGTWDPKTVRTALLKLGYQEKPNGPLVVRQMDARFVTDHYVTPEGAVVSLQVHDDACVIGFVQRSNYQAKATGPYPESGCFEPPFAH
ncbi:hypothetical protein [Kitasatospora sp. NPDC001683]